MYIKKEITSFEELKENSWSGAVDTLNRIEELGLENKFMSVLESVLEMSFENEITDETELNDFIWFETDAINELLERNCNDLFDEEEEEEED